MKSCFFSILIFTLAACSSSEEFQKENTEAAASVQLKRKTKLELAALLPAKLENYNAVGESKGMDINGKTGGFSFTIRKYEKNRDTVYVELHDYYEAPSLFYSYADQWWQSNNPEDNDILTSKYNKFGPLIDAWEVYYKTEKRSTVYVGAKQRYYLIFEAYNKPDPDFIREIAAKFDYSKL